MNPIDIRDLHLHLSGLIAGMNNHMTRGPLVVTRDGEAEAVIIRSAGYAQRLDRFAATYDEGYRCLDCETAGIEWTTGSLADLAQILESANEHWRTSHQQPPVDYRAQTAGLCRVSHPSGWDRCHPPTHHYLTPHRSTVGQWATSDDDL